MYIVEIRHNGVGLAGPMAQFRSWLDRQQIQPSVFRLSLIPEGTIFRLEFKAMGEAEAFALAFGEQVIGVERADFAAFQSSIDNAGIISVKGPPI
jgi:hypothetical protein